MKKGFTLLEMIVVVTVLAILFLLAIPNIKKVTTIINDKGCNAQIKVVDTAILQYKLQIDEYPNSFDDMVGEGLLSDEQEKCSNGKIISIEDGQAYAE